MTEDNDTPKQEKPTVREMLEQIYPDMQGYSVRKANGDDNHQPSAAQDSREAHI